MPRKVATIYRHLTDEQKRIEINTLIREFGPYVELAAKRQRPRDYEDLCQEVWLKAFHHLEKWDPTKSFKNWVARIVCNAAVDMHRREVNFIPTESYDAIKTDFGGDVEFTDETPSVFNQLVSLAESAADIDKLNTVLEGLDPEDFATIRLVEIEELTYQEASIEMELPENTIRSRMHRIRRKKIPQSMEKLGLLVK